MVLAHFWFLFVRTKRNPPSGRGSPAHQREMYLHLGNNVSVPTDDIIGIFDLDNASSSRETRKFLRAAEEEGMVITVGSDLPKSLVVCCPRGSWQRVYITPLAPATLLGRLEALLSLY